jgi:hypothetical protein
MVLVSINAFAGPAPSAFMWDSPLDAHGLCYSRYAHVPSPLPAHAPTLGLTDAGCTHWYRLYTLRTLRRPTTLKPPPLPSVQHYEHPACQPRFGLWTHPAASPGCSQILGRVHLLGLASHFKAVPRRQEKVLLVPAGLASPSSHALWVDNAPLAALHPAAAGTRNLNPRAQRRGGSRGTHPRHAGLRRVEVPEAAGTMNHHDGACGGGG